MPVVAFSDRLKATLVGQTISKIVSNDNGGAQIVFENGPTLFLHALPMSGGTLEADAIENEETGQK